MYDIEGIDELKDTAEYTDEWKSKNPPSEEISEGEFLLEKDDPVVLKRIADQAPVDITEVSDEAGVKLDEEALLADVFGDEPPEDATGVAVFTAPPLPVKDTEVSDRDKIRFEDGDIGLESMANVVHQVWASWMDYMFTKGWSLQDGGFKIDSKSVKRWKRQMNTPYDHLPEDEKQSARDIARRYLNIAWFPPKEENKNV